MQGHLIIHSQDNHKWYGVELSTVKARSPRGQLKAFYTSSPGGLHTPFPLQGSGGNSFPLPGSAQSLTTRRHALPTLGRWPSYFPGERKWCNNFM